ncbi:glutathione S-transferase family protein [Chachezhania sediminis]|uniref:glutathione S-transferase family protein n=1 Tax=Chachezhania sediminis TaxID=2599291 RepID=UPI00131D3841|nr:glutathione S-transferase [Chachezhania sediminis]
MIFYDCATAPNPRRARMVIVEKGLMPETHEISIADNAQLTPEFLAVNPRGTVPVLVTDTGTVLAENLGIAAYLDAAYPEPNLMGRTPDEKGLVMMWNAIAEAQFAQPVAEALRNGNPRMKGRALTGPANFDQIPELAERGLVRADMFYDVLEERLQQSEWLALPDRMTFADISAFVFVQFARVIKKRIPEANAASWAWHDRIAARPSGQA